MTCKKQAEAQPIDGLAIVKETSTLGKLIIKGVPKEEAKRMIVENHYSHKWNEGGFGKYNFGVFRAEEPDKCLGVAVYGYMKNPAAKIFTHPNPKAWVCELNRMWIDDTLGKNAESVLIAASLKLLRKADPNIVAVQSFADGRLGCGTIYKRRISGITDSIIRGSCGINEPRKSYTNKTLQIRRRYPLIYARISRI